MRNFNRALLCFIFVMILTQSLYCENKKDEQPKIDLKAAFDYTNLNTELIKDKTNYKHSNWNYLGDGDDHKTQKIITGLTDIFDTDKKRGYDIMIKSHLSKFSIVRDRNVQKKTNLVGKFGDQYKANLTLELQVMDSQNNLLLETSEQAEGLGYNQEGRLLTSTYINPKKDGFFNSLKNIVTELKDKLLKDKNLKQFEIYISELKRNNSKNIIIWNGISCKNKNSNIQHPFLIIKDNIQNQVDEYLIARNPVDITLRIPKMIDKPILPELPKLVKGQFETKAMFDERVRKAMDERQIQIVDLQEKYREDVEERNKIIENLTIDYEDDLEEIKNEQKLKKEILTQKINEFTTKAFFEVMGVPLLKNPIYDAETEIMYVDLKASNADYNKRISVNVPLSIAENFFNNVESEFAMPIAIYSIKDNSINLDQIKVYSNKEYYFATLTDEDFKPETIEVVLEDKKVKFDSEQQINLKLQNPNLIDTYQVNAIQYGESSDAKGLNYNDDITPLVEKLESKHEDSNKWLFIIAVENYDETDPVTFSKNSAELFKETAQKVFGIKERNTYALIENDATSGKIKDNLQRLIDNVKEGDIIYFYYSGHGVPVPKTEESFILPKDKIVDYISKESEFNLSNIYQRLSVSKAEKVFAFIDACFSGKTDNIPLFKGVAPGLIKTKKINFNKKKMIVITAGKDNQFSNSFDEKGHRMFSYYLIKSLATRKDIDIDLLYKDISVKVHDASFEKGDVYIQEPQIYGNKKLNLFNEE